MENDINRKMARLEKRVAQLEEEMKQVYLVLAIHEVRFNRVERKNERE